MTLHVLHSHLYCEVQTNTRDQKSYVLLCFLEGNLEAFKIAQGPMISSFLPRPTFNVARKYLVGMLLFFSAVKGLVFYTKNLEIDLNVDLVDEEERIGSI